MPSDTRVDELFRKWWDLCRQGQFVPAEEFCVEYPELFEQLEQRIKQHGDLARHDTNGHLETTTDFDDNIDVDSSPTDDELIYTVGQFGRFRFFARGGLGEIYVSDDLTSIAKSP